MPQLKNTLEPLPDTASPEPLTLTHFPLQVRAAKRPCLAFPPTPVSVALAMDHDMLFTIVSFLRPKEVALLSSVNRELHASGLIADIQVGRGRAFVGSRS